MKKYFILLVCSLSLNNVQLKANGTQSKSQEEIRLFSVPATAYSKFDIQVSTEIKGKITRIVTIGESISKGQVIASLDDQYERKIKKHYQTQVEIVTKRIKLLSEQVSRYDILAGNSSVSKEKNENKLLELLTLEQQLQSLKIRITEIEDAISKKNLVAEYDGIVLERKVNVGEAVSAYTPLLRILATKPVYTKARIPVSVLKRLNMESAVLEVEPDFQLSLSLDYVSNEVDISSNTVDVSFRIDENRLIIPGQKGVISFSYHK